VPDDLPETGDDAGEDPEAARPIRFAGGEIPAEIFTFLSRPSAQSLLVRGSSGTGKTTFALGVLRRFPGRRVIATCWVERKRLEAFFPWIAGPEQGIEVIDASRTKDVRGIARSRKLLRLSTGTPGWAVPRSEQWTWLPTPLQELWRSIEPGRPTLVVIDSWDALVESYLGLPATPTERIPDRSELERILLRSMSLVNASLILVVERDDGTPLDHLVDGSVKLETRVADGRRERWLNVQKLRGVSLDEWEHPFTLDGGEFRTIPPIRHGAPDPALRSEPDPGGPRGFLWPGSSDFAEAFGRLPVGHLSLVEVDHGVSATGLRYVLLPMVDAVLEDGGRVLLSVPPTVRVDDLWSTIRARLPPQEVPRKVRVVVTGPATQLSEEVRPAVLRLPDPANGESPVYRDTLGFLMDGGPAPDGQNGAFHWHTGLRLLAESAGFEYNVDTAPQIVQQHLADASAHLMIIGQHGDRVFGALGEMAAMHLRLRDRQGRIFVMGVRPRTQSFALGDGLGSAPYRLIPIV